MQIDCVRVKQPTGTATVPDLMIAVTSLASYKKIKNQAFLAGQLSRVNSIVIPHPPLHRAGKANWGLRELRSAEGVKGEE